MTFNFWSKFDQIVEQRSELSPRFSYDMHNRLVIFGGDGGDMWVTRENNRSLVPKKFLAMVSIKLRFVNWTRLTVIAFARHCCFFFVVFLHKVVKSW